MSTTQPRSPQRGGDYSGGAVGLTVFAAMMMVLGGIMQSLQGLVALTDDTFFVVGADYLFELDVTSWGWIHLVLGVVVTLAGFGLLRGATWARVVAVILASIGIVANFLWLPYEPLWSLTLLTFDVFVIWAVTVHGRDIVAE